MEPKEMLELFRQAPQVYDITNPKGCNSQCEDCIAVTACKQLSNGGDYVLFVKNYNELIVPLVTSGEELCIS